MSAKERRAFEEWKSFHSSLAQAAVAEQNESAGDRLKRISRLEADPEEWFKYYFPKYAKAQPAAFHKAATRRIVKNERWYEVRSWARGMAKSTRTMFEFLYLALTKKVRNIILVSTSYDSAKRLLLPYMINFEKNDRIINDYGPQVNLGQWQEGAFCTAGGVSFTAVGAGQSPRGARNEEIRPDAILIDDIDTDEETRNKSLIQKKWDWIEQALIPTIDISNPYRILFCGNIIAKDCCITRAHEKAHYSDVINIMDKDGNSNWPEKVSQKDISDIQKLVSYYSFQKEWMNNPMSVGTIFEEVTWGECPPLNSLPFAVCYGDPATSNKSRGKISYKSLFLVGYKDSKYYIYTGFLDQAKNLTFVEWYFAINAMVGTKTQVYYFIENNSLQDPFFEQVILPLFYQIGSDKDQSISIKGDTRKKPEKFFRIEGNLEPLNRNGQLIFNIRERENPHMLRLEEQFKMIEAGLPGPADGPDCIEGGVWILKNKKHVSQPASIVRRNPRANPKRY